VWNPKRQKDFTLSLLWQKQGLPPCAGAEARSCPDRLGAIYVTKGKGIKN